MPMGDCNGNKLDSCSPLSDFSVLVSFLPSKGPGFNSTSPDKEVKIITNIETNTKVLAVEEHNLQHKGRNLSCFCARFDLFPCKKYPILNLHMFMSTPISYTVFCGKLVSVYFV